MHKTLMTSAVAVMVVVTGGLLSLAAADWKAPRTPWGDPDLQGIWTGQAELGVPFERPAAFGMRQSLTDEEFAQREAQARNQLESDNADFDPETADTSRAGQVGSPTSPSPTWLERGQASRRTSLVIDPPDGRVPATSPAGLRRLRAAGLGALDNGPFDGPENMGLYQRCITRGVPGAMFPAIYNANTRIVQGPGFVAVTYEMIHETRIIPTTARPHLNGDLREYLGDSRGHWEGDTLVVDVTNFNAKDNYRGSSAGLHLVERYRRTADGLRYEVTVDDPDTWARTWTAALDLRAQPAGMFEYACHEGNYAMKNMLSASRAGEARAANAVRAQENQRAGDAGVPVGPGSPVGFDIAWNHVALSVPNIAESMAWYEKMLGFKGVVRGQPNPNARQQVADLRRGNITIELFQLADAAPLPESRKNPSEDFRTHGVKHFGFEVKNLPAVLAELKAKGVKMAFEMRDTPTEAFAFISDNAGNAIELIEHKTAR